MPASNSHPDLSTLVELFYKSPAALGVFDVVFAEAAPEPYRRLLAHSHHMTVTVEDFHGCPVDVRVLEAKSTGSIYSRKILLTRQTDQRVVLFGIVQLNFEFLNPRVRSEIESQSAPLGRILIEHNVMRQIELAALWRVEPSAELRGLFAADPEQITYGRTAIIRCDGQPAVELLEIVAPVE